MATVTPADYEERIKRIRERFGLTQKELAESIGVSFATVNRWENKQSKPSPLSWAQIQNVYEKKSVLQKKDRTEHDKHIEQSAQSITSIIDFTSSHETVRVVVEGERLSYGYLFNPAFATEISKVDPLPHQRIAVYEYMLRQPRLRFLLADDAGAGKTIMTGLYIREMLARRLISRVFIVPPAGLVGNWESEMNNLFNAPFKIISGRDVKGSNPFVGKESDLAIVSIDTLAGHKTFSLLQQPDVMPYDLVIFDEAHKLSSDRGADKRVRKTARYKLAEAFSGISDIDQEWKLGWRCKHFLLLTATPHMGKEYPYYALWRLLKPNVLSTIESFKEFPAKARQKHFIRRTKEEMVNIEGAPLYPTRISDTLTYNLTQGEISEQTLYNETTEYLQTVYNRAKLLNRTAAQLVMSVFQRRLTSSTYALSKSFERRIAKLEGIIADIQDGRITVEKLLKLQHRLEKQSDIFDTKTAEEEEQKDEGLEENEIAEDRILEGVIATSLAELIVERDQVKGLLDLARQVDQPDMQSKFGKLLEIISDDRHKDEKILIFTEHKDTLEYLVYRFEGLGYTGKIARIHGGMPYKAREQQVDHFRKPNSLGGARFMVATDAAGEGINLQFCWIMINYDVPWNPARLEQRMGRIHRYGQKHDPVLVLNLVASKTREGLVLKTLLDKLEKIRKELNSEKVFDVIGRIFEGVSIKQYMQMAIDETEVLSAVDKINQVLTKENVGAVLEKEKSLYGADGDVSSQLPRLREDMDLEVYTRLLPGYVRQFLTKAAPLVDIGIDGDMAPCFQLRALKPAAMDSILAALETYAAQPNSMLCLQKLEDKTQGIWFHPGEPVFESFRKFITYRLGHLALKGAIFVDPTADKPYLFHVALLSVVRRPDPEISDFSDEEVLEYRLVGLKQYDGGEISECSVEHLLLLKGGRGLPPKAQRLALAANDYRELAKAYLLERVARKMADAHRQRSINEQSDQEKLIRSGFDYKEAELAALRANMATKAREGDALAKNELENVKQLQKKLAESRFKAIEMLQSEPELIEPGKVSFIAHALVVPSTDPEDHARFDVAVEKIAMKVARAHEEASGAVVKDVHTPELARQAGLTDNPGFDLLSYRPDGEKRAIEVKGRAKIGAVDVTDNEWARACNERDDYWLFVVYDCAAPNPRLHRIQDPFGKLLAKQKGGVTIGQGEIVKASEQ